MTTSLERDLSTAMHAYADTVAASADPYDRVAGAVRRDRRRRQVAVAGTLAAVTAVAIGIPAVLGNRQAVAPPATRSSATASDSASTASAASPRVQDWPIRGNLAGDADLVRELAATHRRGQVLYVGDETQRLAVVWYPGTGDSAIGEIDVLTEDKRRASGWTENPQTWAPSGPALVFADAFDGRGDLFVLAAPGTRTGELSTEITVTPEGTIARQWRPLRLEDGVGWARTGSAGSQVARVRVGGYDGPVQGAAVSQRASSLDPCGWCGLADFRASVVESATVRAASALGLPESEVETTITLDAPTALPDGFLPSGPGARPRFIMAGTTIRDGGAVFRSVYLYPESPSDPYVTFEQSVPVPSKSGAMAPYLLPSTDGRRVTVFAPGADRIEWSSQTSGTATLDLTDGVAVIDLPEGVELADLRVVSFGPDGTVGEANGAPRPEAEDPFDLHP